MKDKSNEGFFTYCMIRYIQVSSLLCTASRFDGSMMRCTACINFSSSSDKWHHKGNLY